VNIALLHYACPPVVGGVETVLAQQARSLVANGHHVTVFCGRGAPFADRVRVRVIPELQSTDAALFAVRKSTESVGTGRHPSNELAEPPWPGLGGSGSPAQDSRRKTQDSGLGPDDLAWRVSAAIAVLQQLLTGFDVVIAHNLLTMPFNLVATHALVRLAARGMRIVAWTHDLAAANPDYEVPQGPLFDVLRTRQPRICYVTVSEARARSFQDLTGTAVDSVVPNGIDLASTLGITREVDALLGPLAAEAALLFYPTRILRRKNLELAFEVLAAFRPLAYPVKLVVTGAVNPHGLPDQAYAHKLRGRAEALGVTDGVVWVNERFFVDGVQLRSLYLLIDGVFYPTRQEGFGLPLLEAAAFRVPVFCSAIEPLRRHLPFNSVTFDLQSPSRDIAAKIIRALESDQAYLSRKRLIREHSAQRSYLEQMEPLLRKLT